MLKNCGRPSRVSKCRNRAIPDAVSSEITNRPCPWDGAVANMANFTCPVCGTADDTPVVLVAIQRTIRGGIAEARQYHKDARGALDDLESVFDEAMFSLTETEDELAKQQAELAAAEAEIEEMEDAGCPLLCEKTCTALKGIGG